MTNHTTPLSINSVYSFRTHAPSVLGESFQHMKLISILDYHSARAMVDVDAKYAEVKSHIQGIPIPPIEQTTWYQFKSSSGERSMIARPWINLDTLVPIESVDIIVTIKGTSIEQLDNITSQLSVIPHRDIEIRTV